ncbi:MAG: 3-oxoacyl-[acyl-carrier-protein] reductase [Acidobacteriota bacterium]
MSFDGRTAIITGGTRGIGRAICLELAKRGCNIAFNFTKSNHLAESLMEEISSLGQKALSYQLGVEDHSEVHRMVQDVVKRLGSLDYVVNNAGIVRDTLILRMKEQDWDDVIDINLKGAFNMIRAAAPVMVKSRRGSILNITSVSGMHGMTGQVNYSASKAGIIGLTKALARELASRNITVNALALGFIETEMTDTLNDSYRQSLLNSIPLGRFGNVDEVAAIAAFTLSQASAYITGQVIQVDGGLAI